MNSSQNNNARVDRRWELSATRTITADEFRAMVEICQSRRKLSRKARPKHRDLALLLLSGSAGLRVSEIVALKIGDLENLDQNVLWVSTAKLRNDRGAVDQHLVDDGVVTALRRYLRTLPDSAKETPELPLLANPKTLKPLTRRAVQDVWRRYAEAAGLSYTGIHAGRHLVGTLAARTGDIAFAKRRLRHRSVSSTMVYVHCDVEREKALLEATRVV